jgi:hypothetical protein
MDVSYSMDNSNDINANISRNPPQQGRHNMSGLAPATPRMPATAKRQQQCITSTEKTPTTPYRQQHQGCVNMRDARKNIEAGNSVGVLSTERMQATTGMQDIAETPATADTMPATALSLFQKMDFLNSLSFFNILESFQIFLSFRLQIFNCKQNEENIYFAVNFCFSLFCKYLL